MIKQVGVNFEHIVKLTTIKYIVEKTQNKNSLIFLLLINLLNYGHFHNQYP